MRIKLIYKTLINTILVLSLLINILVINVPRSHAEDFAVFISIGSNPAGATVKVDGKTLRDVYTLGYVTDTYGGESCFALRDPSKAKEYSLEVSYPGYKSYTKKFDLALNIITDEWAAETEVDKPKPCTSSTKSSTIDLGTVKLSKNTEATTPKGSVIKESSGDTGASQDATGLSIPTLKATVQLYENGVGKINLNWSPPTKLPSGATISGYEISRGSPDNSNANAQNNMVEIGQSTTTSFTDTVAGSQTYNYQVSYNLSNGDGGDSSNILSITLTNNDIQFNKFIVQNVQENTDVDYCPGSKLSQPATWFASSLCGLGVVLWKAGESLMDFAQKQLLAVLGYTKTGY
ncbi:MAG: hypothetical protein WC536_01890 [Patescibacteria group bacterium]